MCYYSDDERYLYTVDGIETWLTEEEAERYAAEGHDVVCVEEFYDTGYYG